MPRRNRVLFIGQKSNKSVFSSKASNVGAINNLYTLTDEGSKDSQIEDIWTRYETNLSYSINQMIRRNLSPKSWIRTLVPFVACMLVRGPDFNIRFVKRLHSSGFPDKFIEEQSTQDQINRARLLDLQRMLGLVSVSKWIVIESNIDEPLITNDWGFTPYVNPMTNERGMAIALNTKYLLVVIPKIDGLVATMIDGVWRPLIEYEQPIPRNLKNLNFATMHAAREYIFGPEKEQLKNLLKYSLVSPLPHEPSQLGFTSSKLAVAHEFTWHNLAVAIEDPKSTDIDLDFTQHLKLLAKGWVPPLIMPMNLVRFPSPLKREGDSIFSRFYDPEIYYKISEIKNLEAMGEYKDVITLSDEALEIADTDQLKIPILVSKGGALDELNNFDEAIILYDQVLGLDPHSVEALVNKGVTLSKQNKFEEAIEVYSRAIEINPDFPISWLNRGGTYIESDDLEKAFQDIDKAESLMSRQNEIGTAQLARGLAFYKAKKYREAINQFTIAEKQLLNTRTHANLLFYRALSEYVLNEPMKALDDLDQTIASIPDFWAAYYLKARLQADQSKTEDAISTISFVVENTKDQVELSRALSYRVNLYLAEEKIELAKRDLDSIDINLLKEADVLGDSGVSYLLMGDPDKALLAFEKVLELDKVDPKALHNRGLLFALDQDHEIAIQLFDRALGVINDEDPEKAGILRNKSMCLAILGRLDEATQVMGDSEELDNSSFNHDVLKGILEFYKGNYQLAVKMERDAQSRSDFPDSPNPYLPLALLGVKGLKEAIYEGKKLVHDEKSRLNVLVLIMHLLGLQKRTLKIEGIQELINSLQVDSDN